MKQMLENCLRQVYIIDLTTIYTIFRFPGNALLLFPAEIIEKIIKFWRYAINV